MKKFLLTLLIGGVSLATAWATQHAAQAQIEAVLELSGASRQIAQIPHIMTSQVAQQRANAGAEGFAHMSRALEESFQAESLQRTVIREARPRL